MNILVIGANGNIGKKIVEKIHKNTDHSAKAMVRKESQIEQFKKQDIETVLADLENDFSHAYEDVNAVIFTAGSGASTGDDKTKMVDHDGAIKAIDFATKNNIDHFIMISAFGADLEPDKWPEQLKAYYQAKSAADEYLIQSNLNYTILKPGALTDDQPSGKVDLAVRTEKRGGSISRWDVAEVCVQLINNEGVFGSSFELLEGKKPIKESIEELIK